MNTAHRELILDELGLLPLWTRRELLADEQPQTIQASTTTTAQATTTAVTSVPTATTPPSAMPTIAPTARVETTVQTDSVSPTDNTTDTDIARRRAIADMDWTQLQAAVASCTACPLHKHRNRTVFGTGEPAADWLVVGEAPGAEEDRQGEPFVGQAGKLLDNMLAAVDRTRQSNVYILNTIKCRPPQNRNPTPDELAACAPFLHRQIALIQPKVIFAVGRFAVQTLLERDATIASLRGKLHHYRQIPVVVSYHPAYLLRNQPDKYKAWQDLLAAKKVLADATNTSAP